MNNKALKELLFKIADDQLILGHRNSEWTGLGPILEEDIAFSSMAQDKIGHSYAMYQILEELGEGDPDQVAFFRKAEEFHNSQLVELPIGEYSFSLIRHFLYDHSDFLRFDMLRNSSYELLAQVSSKIRSELKYHTMHARTWVKKLGTSTDESISRLQNDLDVLMPYALGLFEKSPFEEEIIAENIFRGEEELKTRWLELIEPIISQTDLVLPEPESIEPVIGGRVGKHTEHLQPLIDEMTEVMRIDPGAEW